MFPFALAVTTVVTNTKVYIELPVVIGGTTATMWAGWRAWCYDQEKQTKKIEIKKYKKYKIPN